MRRSGREGTWALLALGARLPELIPTYDALKLPAYHYLCRRVALDWRSSLPEGYTTRRRRLATAPPGAANLTISPFRRTI